MQLDTANPFQSFLISKEELVFARQVSPLFFALLQNHIAEKAREAVEFSYRDRPDAQAAIIEHECLKAQVSALTDLMNELTPPTDVS
jgi:hypothetical protein